MVKRSKACALWASESAVSGKNGSVITRHFSYEKSQQHHLALVYLISRIIAKKYQQLNLKIYNLCWKNSASRKLNTEDIQSIICIVLRLFSCMNRALLERNFGEHLKGEQEEKRMQEQLKLQEIPVKVYKTQDRLMVVAPI